MLAHRRPPARRFLFLWHSREPFTVRGVLVYGTVYPEASRAIAKLITTSGLSPASIGGIDQSIRIDVGVPIQRFELTTMCGNKVLDRIEQHRNGDDVRRSYGILGRHGLSLAAELDRKLLRLCLTPFGDHDASPLRSEAIRGPFPVAIILVFHGEKCLQGLSAGGVLLSLKR
jgi:hypothetical protein